MFWGSATESACSCGFVNGAHLAGELCDRLPQTAHRDRLDDARFRDLAALTGLAMRPNAAVAVRRVAHYRERLFVQLIAIPTHRQPVNGVVHDRGYRRVVVRHEQHRVCRNGGIPQCIDGAWELDGCRRFAKRRQPSRLSNTLTLIASGEFSPASSASVPLNELSQLPTISNTLMPDTNMILRLYASGVFGGGVFKAKALHEAIASYLV
jgi:hypothetical protein